MAAVSGVIRPLVSQLTNVGPNGMAIEILGNKTDRLYQKISCTSSGVPRKNQMKRPASEAASVSFDMRATATASPSTEPSTIATAVRPSDTVRPFKTVGSKKYCATTGQPKFGLMAQM